MLSKRLLVTVLLLPPLAALVYFGGLPLAITVVVAALIGAHELQALLAAARLPVFAWPLGGAVVILALAGARPDLQPNRFAIPFVLIGVSIWALAATRGRIAGGDPAETLRDATVGWAATLAGAFYIGLPFGTALALRATPGEDVALLGIPLPIGAVWLALALAITWLGDTAAYFVGRRFGRHHFSRLVSPKKTVEGLVGGVAMATIVGTLCGPFVGLAPAAGLLLGACGGFAGIAGDLMESLLKRAAGVKDSGTIFPGHGGMLDRIDAVLFVVLIVYCFQQLTSQPLL